MDGLLSLPDEVLSKIFAQLDVIAISSFICAFPYFKKKILDLFTIVCDEPESNGIKGYFPGTPIVGLNDFLKMTSQNESWGVLLILTQAPDDPTEIDQIIKKVRKLSTITLVDKQLECIDDWYNGLLVPRKRSREEICNEKCTGLMRIPNDNRWVENVSFPFVTTVFLDNLELDPGILSFRQLEDLRLKNCVSGDKNLKFDLPKIQQIQLIGTCQSIMESLDFEKYPKTLVIDSEDMGVFENIRFLETSSLCVFTSLVGLGEMRNIELPKTKTFFPSGFRSLSNIHSNSVEEFSISSRDELSQLTVHIHDIEFPNLKSFLVENVMLKDMMGLNCSSLSDLSIHRSQILNNQKYLESVFGNLTKLGYTDSTPIFEKLKTENLEEFSARVSTKEDIKIITSKQFPSLSLLNLDFGSIDETGYVLKPAPNLTDVELSASKGLNFLRNSFSNITYLVLDSCSGPWSLEGVSFQNLRYFEVGIKTPTPGCVKIHSCHFPKLKSFSIEMKDSIDVDIKGIFENIEAPMLQSISYGLAIDILDLSKISHRLEDIEISNVQCLILGDSSNLESLKDTWDGSLKTLIITHRETLENLEHIEIMRSGTIESFEDLERRKDKIGLRIIEL